MGRFIDFGTDCPWQLYIFAFLHIFDGLFMYFFDTCKIFTQTSTPCTGAELLIQRLMAIAFIYVGLFFSLITYHNRDSPAKITTLSSFALHGATALLIVVIFTGNAAFGGLEKSWMHIADMLTTSILVTILAIRVYQPGSELAQRNPLRENLGINCKTLLIFMLLGSILKFFAYTDFVDPLKFLADGLEITTLSRWMWSFSAVLIFEIVLALAFTLFFDDDSGHEIIVSTIIFMSLVASCSIYPLQGYMSSWMGLNGSGLWIRVGIVLAICIAAIAGGRIGGSHRVGYSSV